MKCTVIILILMVISVGAYYLLGLNHDFMEEMTHLHGKTELEVVEILGEQDVVNVHTLKYGVTLPEKYIEIHNTYNPNDPNIDNVKIKEMMWDGYGYTISLFLHEIGGQWVVLDSIRYKDGTQF